jgi:transcriptional regulator with GAF, ATPase, and Fis domain
VILSVILALHTWHHRRTRALEEKKKTLELQVKERTAFAEALQHALTEVESLKNRLEAENTYLQDEIKVVHNFADIISRSEVLKKVLRKVEQVAATDATVLILGESGTGKELLARAVHNLSARRERPLVKVNCAALPANLVESELFGHEKGAFTGAICRKIGRFELADHSTIFLDEIGELPLELQAKLLRILQEGEFERLGGQQTLKVNTRVIAATNRDLKEEIAAGRFREDLFYRLNVFPITIPPLRERKEDIPLLVNHFMKKYSAKIGKKIETVSQHVIDELQQYDWPGNVRELENVVERAVIVSQGKQLRLEDGLPHSDGKTDGSSTLTLEELEKRHILKVLEQTGWRISGERGAAKILNIKPTTLRSRMEKLGIKR